ncbi:hypothetical protein SPRG_21484 [Saprolegnia parasitica CBS 223.65]|uniref:Uncharacterized protein n=1 Tax=Saprolegnia parasitica (strain CBS 223.65) TaxID=695850 RepID=A0A067BWY4_SAPPC|nr:hypothetical protein SPRG_21484 [Saprolegnia parasitica CBS 223.65]KDO19102.1 hypothetical protein SPRG_21484 [Saprolegnia parasitica CBS 223.65]|eukprot:XP_012210174.1 hypothetical protein SPRG_21484 [Saprolegnia parasitica CBS 223.65]
MVLHVAAATPVTTKKRKLHEQHSPLDRIKPSQDPRLAHIKSKRTKQLQSLLHHVYDLETEVARLKRGHLAMLPWEDVVIALKDDTLEQVRENRSLKRQVDAYAHLSTVVTNALERTERSFVKAYRRQGAIEDLFVPSDASDVQLVQEDSSSQHHKTRYNVVRGQFCEPNRTVVALRTVLKDELFPLERNTWVLNTKQWWVADRIGPTTTRCRTFYTIDHPFTEGGGYVSLRELAACYNIQSDDTKVIAAGVRARYEQSHVNQRVFFKRRFEEILALIAPANEHRSPPLG